MASASAIVWGGGDFSGGVAVKAAGGTMRSAFRVVLISHTISLTILLLLTLIWGGPHPSGVTVAWGLVAGILAALSLTTFYVALSGGAMGAAAALSGLLAAAIPAVVSSYTEGVPGALRLVGFVVAGVAIWLIAAGPAHPPGATHPEAPLPASRRAMLLAIAAGVGFGLYFVAMKMAGRGGLLWPMTTVRIGSAATCAILVLATLRSRNPPVVAPSTGYLPRKAVLWALGPAFLDTCGNLLFMAATRMGRLDIAAVLASLYPASTILLAAWMFHERPTRGQGLGMLVAAAAVVMISL
ncbi:MAG: EamA family transporter [Acidobacteriaceae bacterium]